VFDEEDLGDVDSYVVFTVTEIILIWAFLFFVG
jgi:hypothetical protein